MPGFAKALLKMYFQYRCYIALVKIELSFEGIIFTRKNDTSVFLGWVLAWSGETLLFCRQLHKRAINNLRPGNYWTFPNTHGPGSFCSTNNLKDASASDWIQENWHLYALRPNIFWVVRILIFRLTFSSLLMTEVSIFQTWKGLVRRSLAVTKIKYQKPNLKNIIPLRYSNSVTTESCNMCHVCDFC